jgi:hypothetical protein
MKMKVYIMLFLYATFLLTPLIVRLIENSNDTSTFFNLSEEEVDSEKEFITVLYLESLKETIVLNQSNSCKIFHEISSKHELISFTVLIPPPEQV